MRKQPPLFFVGSSFGFLRNRVGFKIPARQEYGYKMRPLNTEQTKRLYRGAFTIIEALMTVLILMVVLTGAWRFRYQATIDALKAKDHLAAGRIANLLMQTWTAQNGCTTFNPSQQNFGATVIISNLAQSSTQGLSKLGILDNFVPLGVWMVRMENRDFRVGFLYRDESSVQCLRTLYVFVEWSDRKNATQHLRLVTYTNT